ncbi:MAG TPA: LPS assembly protein LptD, partial [Candidatus Hydrogenedentes bacterium]|nr:LPS assembly protein LptD [Candidatus Hydrogenedentota bacterium]
MRHVTAIILVLYLFGAGAASGQPAFQTQGVRAQFRDAVLDPASGRLYVAVYNWDEVWVYDPATLERLARIAVGDGPTAIALSHDGATVACVNHLAGSVALIRTSDDAVKAVVPCGKGAAAVAATRENAFVVVSPFEDSVVTVSATGQAQPTPLAGAPAVPVAVAAGETLIAVAGRAEASLVMFSPAGDRVGEAPLPEPATRLAALEGDRFLVAMRSGLAVIDGTTRRVAAQIADTADDVAAADGKAYALAGDRVRVLDARLRDVDAWTLSAPAQALAVAPGVYVALAPQRKEWQVWNAAGTGATAIAMSTEEVGRPTPEEDGGETPPLLSEDSIPTVEAEAVEDVPEIVAEPPSAETEEMVEATEEPAASQEDGDEPPPLLSEAAPAQEDGAETPLIVSEAPPAAERRPPAPTPAKVDELQVVGGEIRAPRLGRRPSAVPMQDFSGPTLADALSTGADFGAAESLFQTPDWTQPLRDLEADEMGGSFDGDTIEATGNVRLRLGETLFSSDYYSFTESIGEMHARGNVRMEQPTGSFTADEVYYTLPPEAEVPPPMLFELTSEQERAKRRLSLGRLSATDVRIVEPWRELVADHVDYDAVTETGELLGVRGRNGDFYFGAAKLRVLGPRSFEAEEVWLTTCDTEPAPYKIRLKELTVTDGVPVHGKHARLQLRNLNTPLYMPFWKRDARAGYPWSVDFDSGRRAEIGFFVNVGQRFHFTPNVAAGPRLFITQKEGVGIGGDLEYDFMEAPASRLFRSRGELHGFETTEGRGYVHWYHRFEPNDDFVVRMQAEQWGDRDFYKDFFYQEFRDRTTPRTFVNATYTRPTYVATATTRLNTHNWVTETERLPEASFHLIDRRIAPRLYFTFDSVAGYNDREPVGGDAVRTVNTSRLTYEIDLGHALSLTPFWEADVAWYSKERIEDDASFRFGNTVGATLQTRFHKNYAGRWGFSGFKHVVVPSITYSYRPENALSFDETPRFDALDNAFGRSRIETKLDNVVFGRDAETGEVWQVGRLTLY